MLACVGMAAIMAWLVLSEGSLRLSEVLMVTGIWIGECAALYGTGWGIAWAIAGFKRK